LLKKNLDTDRKNQLSLLNIEEDDKNKAAAEELGLDVERYKELNKETLRIYREKFLFFVYVYYASTGKEYSEGEIKNIAKDIASTCNFKEITSTYFTKPSAAQPAAQPAAPTPVPTPAQTPAQTPARSTEKVAKFTALPKEKNQANQANQANPAKAPAAKAPAAKAPAPATAAKAPATTTNPPAKPPATAAQPTQQSEATAPEYCIPFTNPLTTTKGKECKIAK